MAVYRQIQITYWQDNFVLKLTPEEKFFYLYLLTNSKTKQCGIYELPLQIVQIETGYNRETVIKLLQRFIDHNKIKYDWEGEEIFMLNWMKHNPYDKNPNIEKCIRKELKDVKNASMIPLTSPLQALLQQEEEKEQKETPKEEKELETLVSYWNATLTTPKLLEREFIGELFDKFGFKKSKLLIRQFKEGNFHSLRTMRESLNEDGTIKPRSENSPESKKHYKTTAELKKELYG